ncbi:MAG: alpha-galactosidase [Psychromonas sp.]
MVNKESILYREHPDWLLELSGYEQPSCRWQYLLDLQNPDCFNYLYERLNNLLSRYNIAYLTWDMNRELVQPGHHGKPAVNRQTKALYALIDKLLAVHTEIEIESCSSGGGRIDFEILKRTHRFWASDSNDALERQAIQRDMSYFSPPEVMGAHIGPDESHTTRSCHHMNLRGMTALSGHMGVELDPVKASQTEKDAMAKYIALHKKFRQLQHTGRSFRLDTTDKNQNVYGVLNDNHSLSVNYAELCLAFSSSYCLH